MKTKNWIFWRSNKQRDLSLLLYEKRKTFYPIILAIRFCQNRLWWQKRTTFRRISVTMDKNLVKSDVVKQELKAYESTTWNSKVRFQVKYYCQVQWFSPHRINGSFSDKCCSSVPPPSSPLPITLLDCPTKQPYSK